MKCQNCPLYKIKYDYLDCDEYCLADWENQDFPNGVWTETGGCRRTDKWILSQDPDELELKHFNYDCECWAEYEKEFGEENKDGTKK